MNPTDSGAAHAALMVVTAFAGAAVLGLLFGLVVAFIARRLAAFTSTSFDEHTRYLRTGMRIISVVLAPLAAYYIHAGTAVR